MVNRYNKIPTQGHNQPNKNRIGTISLFTAFITGCPNFDLIIRDTEAIYSMAILKDPEGNENTILQAMIVFKGLNVLEIGCGEGRFTWHYAHKASHVTAIDPDEEEIEKPPAKEAGGVEGTDRFF